MGVLRGPAYRIETSRLSLRCLEPMHAPLMSEAIEASLSHLRPWMGWAVHEPLDAEERLELMRARRGHFDLGGDLHYGVFDKRARRLLGGATLILRGEVEEREVGYWIRSDSLRMGLASEAVAAVVRVAFDIERLSGLDIRTDPVNEPSARVALKLGFAGPVLDPSSEPTPEGEKRDTHVYSLARILYAASPLRDLPIEAYDVLGRRLL